jgi:hypothetical protein
LGLTLVDLAAFQAEAVVSLALMQVAVLLQLLVIS